MSIKASSLAGPANLAEVIERIASSGDLAPQRRQDLASGVRQIARVVGGLPADVPADPEALKRGLKFMTPAAAGMTKSRFGNVLALLASALELSGANIAKRNRAVELTPAWTALWSQVEDKYVRWSLSRFFRFASANGVEPDQVSDRTLADFDEALKHHSLLQKSSQVIADLCREWNRCGASIEGWPATRLTAPDRRRQYALPESDFPPSFGAEVTAYLDRQARGDLFVSSGHGPASPVTIYCLRLQLFQLATALVKSGRAPETICSLSDLVEPQAMKIALNFFWARNGKRKTTQLRGFVLTALKIAKYWVEAPPEQIKMLQKMRREVSPEKTGMTARNRARLRQFDDPENLRRLIDLPAAIVAALPKKGAPTLAQASRVQSALAIAILTVAPMRMKNLAALQLGRHVVQNRPGGVRHIVIAAEEVKNHAPLAFEISGALGAILDVYLKRCRPRLKEEPKGFLFPARKGGAKTPSVLADQIKRTLRQEAGIDLNPHAFRHLAAKLLLREHPGEYETVRLLLGHKDLSTTTGHYAGLEQADALRRYDALIDQRRNKEVT